MSVTTASDTFRPERRAARRPTTALLLNAWRHARTRIGVGLVLVLILVAVFGPLFAPHDIADPIAAPLTPPSGEALLGTDNLGRDVLSRFLHGGRTVLLLSALATVIGCGLGVTIGLLSAYSRELLDNLLMRAMDVILAFPAILLALILVTTVGPKLWLLVIAVALIATPQVARLTRGAAVDVVRRDFVLSARALGESRVRILASEIFPNLLSVLAVEFSLRFSYAIAAIASLSFLGLGLQPPAADWGLMINENRLGLEIQPYAVLVPVIAIAALTVGTSLIGDGMVRARLGLEDGKE